jgi:Osmosensitive K+ channel histidine kinase
LELVSRALQSSGMSDTDQIRLDAAGPNSTRGRLKVFLGYAPGVGKSFRMFDEARRRKERGQDVVVGALQPQVPPEIEPLLSSLEIVPTVDREGVPVIDVPAILRRHPQVCVVDGLAYDSPWGRNVHRWQDVEELLANGINVVASVNLQHLDDQREAVEKLTGTRVLETIPRQFLNTADEIVVVDAPTEGSQPELVALREMALVLSADVIDAGLQRYLQAHDIEPAWRTHERFLVCLTARANADRMIASARQSAARFHCDVLAIYVRLPNSSEAEHKEMEAILAHARAAGARVDVLESDDPVESIVQYARSHGVTQIFVGHSMKNDWGARLWGTPVSRLIRAAEGMDVRVFPHQVKSD